MKITAQTSICHHIPDMVREYLNEGMTRFEQVVRQQQALTDPPRAFHYVTIELEPDESPAYDYPISAYPYSRWPHRPRLVELRWTWGNRRCWKLDSVLLTGSSVLKSGRLSKHTACQLFVLGPFPYARSQNPADLPVFYRQLVTEHAPRALRAPNAAVRARRDTPPINLGNRVQIHRDPFSRTWPGFFGYIGTVVQRTPDGGYGVTLDDDDVQVYWFRRRELIRLT